MKRICILLTGILLSVASFAQIDSTANQPDTIKVGGMIIIKKKSDHNQDVNIQKRKDQGHSKISTNWWIIDIGFANYTDNTNYAAAQASGFLANNVGADQLDLRNGKSVDVNLWIFMQRLNLIKNVVNLKYGLGVELNNYRYKSPVKYETSPTHIILDQSTSYKKNKLAADYITVPLMLNFNLTPDRKRDFGYFIGTANRCGQYVCDHPGCATGYGPAHGSFCFAGHASESNQYAKDSRYCAGGSRGVACQP